MTFALDRQSPENVTSDGVKCCTGRNKVKPGLSWPEAASTA